MMRVLCAADCAPCKKLLAKKSGKKEEEQKEGAGQMEESNEGWAKEKVCEHCSAA